MKHIAAVGGYFIMLYDVFRKRTRWSIMKDLILREIDDLIFGSIGIVTFISFFVGGVVAVQTALNIDNPFIPKYLIVEPGDNILITFSDYLKMFKPKTINRTPESKSEKDIARFKKQISLIEAINGGHPEEKGEQVNQKVEFIVKAIIVTVVDTIQKRTIGCKFLAINEELSKYVNEKQMEKRRMKLK